VPAVRNNDELYARKDVDAVIIATADFQHALHAIEAVESGRDAYVEKPLANTMADARAVLQAVDRSGRIVQAGTQRRSAPVAIAVRDFLQSGRFGDLNVVHFSWRVNDPGRWRRPKVVAQLRPEDTDWGRYQMNRPKRDFDARRYVEFRLFWPYSSGIPDQWLVHEIDLVHWFTGLPRPRSVVANGGVYQWRDGRQNADTLAAVFDYGPLDDPSRGFQVLFEARMANATGGQLELFCSNAGSLDLNTGEVSPDGGLQPKEAAAMGVAPILAPRLKLLENVKEISRAANTGADEATAAHMRNWMECVRSRKQPAAGVRAGYNHSVALAMTIAALHTGRRVTFDEARQDVIA
jgi:predicted dehydrogenase